MPATPVTFGPGGIREIGVHRVYFRAHWSGDWSEIEDLHCTEAAWSLAPTLPTATLEWHYGSLKQIGSNTFENFAKLSTLGRVFIKIEFDIERNDEGVWLTRDWYGVCEGSDDALGGAVFDRNARGAANVATGRQVFHCYGLEKLLADHFVRGAYFEDSADHAVYLERGLTTNRGNKPNRSANKVEGSYVFDPAVDTENPANNHWWSTRDLVEYLLTVETPLDAAEEPQIVFQLDTTNIPNWDRPEIELHHQTTYSLLDRVLNRQRLLAWRIGITAGEPILKCFTHTKEGVPIDGVEGFGIERNIFEKSYHFDRDQLTSASVRTAEHLLFDQVLVRGARIRCVGTFSKSDETIETAFTSAEEVTYDEGASKQPGYADLGTEEKQRRNAEARAVPKLDHVYCRFRIPPDWDFQVKDGEAGDAHPLFLTPGGAASQIFYPDLVIDHSLPLLKGVDYSLDKIKAGTYVETPGERQESPPLVFFLNPASSPNRWVDGSKLARAANLETKRAEELTSFSVHVHVVRESQAVELRVSGSAQHAIAYSQFTRLPVDEPTGQYDYQGGKMLMTLCLIDDRSIEKYWPKDPPAGRDALRTKLIEAGDDYPYAYVAPGTVVGVNAKGELQRSSGGYYPKKEAHDVPARLLAAAKIAAAWYCVPHQSLSLATRRLRIPDDVELGDFVTEIGDPDLPGGHRQTINGLVTEIRIETPRNAVGETGEPVMHITTWCGELDPLSLEPAELLPAKPAAAGGPASSTFKIGGYTGEGDNPERRAAAQKGWGTK